jgi:hypothetical protein
VGHDTSLTPGKGETEKGDWVGGAMEVSGRPLGSPGAMTSIRRRSTMGR